MASAISQTAQPRLALPQDTTTAPPSGGATTINPRTRLLLEGPIAATLLRLAPPNLVVNVILIAVTASIDAHFVGRLGAPALAGVSLVFPLMMLMQQIANSSMGSAIAASVARAVGASRRDDAASAGRPWPRDRRRDGDAVQHRAADRRTVALPRARRRR